MQKLLAISGLLILAGLRKIGGGYLIWDYLLQNKPLSRAIIAAEIFVLYGVVVTLQRLPSRPVP